MAILLTGGAGFIGSHTAVSLLNAGLEIVIVDNLYNSSPKVIDRIETITGKRPAFVEADCTIQRGTAEGGKRSGEKVRRSWKSCSPLRK